MAYTGMGGGCGQMTYVAVVQLAYSGDITMSSVMAFMVCVTL